MATITSLHRDAGADPLRAALEAALHDAGEARQGVERQRGGIERARIALRSAEKAVKTAEKGVKEAQEAHARAIADAATADGPLPLSGVRAARQAVADAQDEVEAAQGALNQLKADLPAWEADAREKEIAVEAAISAVLAPHAQQLIERAAAVARELSPLRAALFAVWNDQPSGVADHLAFSRGRKPLAEVQTAVGNLLSTIDAADDKQAIALWRQARENLRADPHAPLPDFAPPPPNAA